MPTVVNIPNVGTVRFPDDMDTASIEDAIRTKILPQAQPAELLGPPATPPPTEGVDLTGGITFNAYSQQREIFPPAYNEIMEEEARKLLQPYGYNVDRGNVLSPSGGNVVGGSPNMEGGLPPEVLQRAQSILSNRVAPDAEPELTERQQAIQEPFVAPVVGFTGSLLGGLTSAVGGITKLVEPQLGEEIGNLGFGMQQEAQTAPGALSAIARGAGSVAAFAPSMAMGGIPGILAATTQMVAQAKNDTRAAEEARLRAAGFDEGTVQMQADEAAQNAALFTAATMPIYLATGRGVAALTGKMLPNLAPVGKVAAQTATATGANVGTGALMRALEGQEAAPTLEQFTADALWGVVHGVGVRASERARQRAEAELVSRGFAYHEVMNPDPQAFAENMARLGITAPEGGDFGKPPAPEQTYAQQDTQTGTPDGGVRPRSEIQEVPPAEGGEGVQPSGQGGPPPATPVAAQGEVTPPNFGPGAANAAEPFSTAKVIGAYNAKVDEQRAQRGLPPLMSEGPKSFGVSWENAERLIEADPEMPRRLTEEILRGSKRRVTDEEQAALLWRIADLKNKRDMEDIRALDTNLPEAERVEAESRSAMFEQDLQRTEEADRMAGTESSRSLNIRKLLIRDDFTLANMERESRKVKKDVLTPDERLKLKGISETVLKADEGMEARKTEVEQADRDAAIEESIKALEVEASKDPAFTPEVKSLADRIIARLQTARQQASGRLRGLMSQLGSAPDVSLVAKIAKEFTIMAAADISRGVLKFGQWAVKMVNEFGEKAKPYLQDAWKTASTSIDEMVDSSVSPKMRDKVKAAVKKTDALNEADTIAATMKEKLAEGGDLKSLIPQVDKLKKMFVRQGINKREPLIDAVHGVLETIQPGISRDTVTDLVGKYGVFRPLSKDAVSVTVRELSAEAQLVSKLRDVQNRIPLAKSGPERAKLSDEARRLQQQLNEAKKKYGVVVTDPAKQLKSATDAVITRLRNSIVDLTNMIETGERPKGKTPVPETPEIARLRAMRDRVRSTLEDIEGKPEMTEQQRIAAAEKAMEGQIAELQRRITTGDTATRLPRERPRSAHLDALRAEKDALQAQLDELRAADAAVQEERAFDALSRQAADLEGRLSRGELTQERTTQLGPDTELVAAARERVNAAKDALAKAREASPEVREKRIQDAADALQKSIAEYDRRIRTEDFSTRTQKEVPPQLEALKAERDALRKFYNELRNAAKPKMSPEEVANRNFRSRKLREIAEYKRRIAEGEFAPKERKPFDVSKDPEFQRLAAEAEVAKAEFAKLRAKWQREQDWKNKTRTEKVLHGLFETWNAAKNLNMIADLSATIQAGWAMFAHPVKGAQAIGKGLEVFLNSIFTKQSLAAKRLQAQLENSPNAKNGLYKKMGLDLRLGESRDENASSIIERLADLETEWAGIPDVVKGLMNMKGKQMAKGFTQLAKFVPKAAGRIVRGSNEAFQAIVNTMRAVAADSILKTNFKDSSVAPTDVQLKLVGNAANAFTGSGGVKNSRALTVLLHAPNFYWGMLKNVTGEPIIRSMIKHEGRMAAAIAKEYVRALSSVAVLLAVRQLFFGDDRKNRLSTSPDALLDPSMGQLTLPSGITIDLTQGRAKWLSLVAQLARGQSMRDGRVVNKRQDQILMDFIKGRLSPDLRTSAMLLSMKDYHGNDLDAEGVVKNLMTPITWKNFGEILRKEGYTKGTFIQLLNFIFGNVNLPPGKR